MTLLFLNVNTPTRAGGRPFSPFDPDYEGYPYYKYLDGYRVVLEPEDTFIGTVNEDFAVESLPGDVFQLGNASWRILKIEQGRVRVEDAYVDSDPSQFRYVPDFNRPGIDDADYLEALPVRGVRRGARRPARGANAPGRVAAARGGSGLPGRSRDGRAGAGAPIATSCGRGGPSASVMNVGAPLIIAKSASTQLVRTLISRA